jgi:uncharacterized membrane protein YfcA
LKNKQSLEANANYRKAPIAIVARIIIGAVVDITSTGAGSLFALFILFFYNLNSSEVVGTDIFHALFLVSLPGLLMDGYGHIDYRFTGNLAVGSLSGIIIGSKLTKKILLLKLEF